MFSFIEKVQAQAPVEPIQIPRPTNVFISNIGSLVSAVVSVLLIVAALAAFLYLVLGGIQWITSGGDKAGMEAARNKITQAIVGLIIVGAAYAVMMLVANFLGLDITNLQFDRPFGN